MVLTGSVRFHRVMNLKFLKILFYFFNYLKLLLVNLYALGEHSVEASHNLFAIMVEYVIHALRSSKKYENFNSLSFSRSETASVFHVLHATKAASEFIPHFKCACCCFLFFLYLLHLPFIGISHRHVTTFQHCCRVLWARKWCRLLFPFHSHPHPLHLHCHLLRTLHPRNILQGSLVLVNMRLTHPRTHVRLQCRRKRRRPRS